MDFFATVRENLFASEDRRSDCRFHLAVFVRGVLIFLFEFTEEIRLVVETGCIEDFRDAETRGS